MLSHMRIGAPAFGALVAIATIPLAGCGNRETAPLGALPAQVRTENLPDAQRSYAFTCQNGSVFDCLVYTAGGKLLRTRKHDVESPLGVAAGSDGRLYVANEFGSDVLVYSSGGRKLSAVLSNGGNVPIDVAVFHGEVAVSNQHVMTFFSSGATAPTRTLRAPSVLQGTGAAFDPSGNCYWSYYNEVPKLELVEFVGCKGKARVRSVSPGGPYGIAFDGSGNLYYSVFAESRNNGVYRCSGLSSCSLFFEAAAPEYLNFSQNFQDLWISVPGGGSPGNALYEIDVASGKVVQEITAGLTPSNPPTGVAAAPGPF